jgi:glucosamine-6-phosphate deaminase
MRIVIEEKPCEFAAKHMIKRLKDFVPTDSKKYFVLGLPSFEGSARGMFEYLIAEHKKGNVSFRNVATFQMDEFYKIEKTHAFSMCTVMYRNFFKHIDILPENVHILDSKCTDPDVETSNFERRIKEYGGIDFLFCGVGADGSIARNEPGASLASRTRLKTLTYVVSLICMKTIRNIHTHTHRLVTIQSLAARLKLSVNSVPKVALTMGLGTILDAKEIMVLFLGQSKAFALHRCVEYSVNHMYPASVFQLHDRCIFVCDEKATMDMSSKTVRYFNGIGKVAQETLGSKNACDFSKSSMASELKLFHRRMLSNPHRSNKLSPHAMSRKKK